MNPLGGDAPGFTLRYVDLAQPRLGARVVAVSDEFFAPGERLIDPAPPVFIPGKYDEHGKWMDGWESRRRRTPGHDWCVLRICAGVIHGADIDTSFFTGNHPPRASLSSRWCGSPPPLPARPPARGSRSRRDGARR